jgi:hypothetical protein
LRPPWKAQFAIFSVVNSGSLSKASANATMGHSDMQQVEQKSKSHREHFLKALVPRKALQSQPPSQPMPPPPPITGVKMCTCDLLVKLDSDRSMYFNFGVIVVLAITQATAPEDCVGFFDRSSTEQSSVNVFS